MKEKNEKLLKKEYEIIEIRTRILIHALRAGCEYIKEQKSIKKELSVEAVVKDNINDVVNFFCYHAETCRLMNKFLEDYDNYQDESIDSCINMLHTIKQLLDPYKETVTKYMFV